jgi:hypothetical protein
MNVLLHTSQQYGRPPPCSEFLCCIRLPFTLKVLLHTSQQNGRSPLCMRWWFTNLLLWMNALLHTSQKYGQSPLCKRLCVKRLVFLANVLLHTLQQYGRSPVCKRLCSVRLLFWVNALLHTSQQYGRSTRRGHLCLIRSLFRQYSILHTLHENQCTRVCTWSSSFPVTCQKYKVYTLGYFLIGRTSILNAMWKKKKKIFWFKELHIWSKAMRRRKQKSDNSEWKYYTHKLLLGSINFHKILGEISNTQVSEGWYMASSMPKSHKI